MVILGTFANSPQNKEQPQSNSTGIKISTQSTVTLNAHIPNNKKQLDPECLLEIQGLLGVQSNLTCLMVLFLNKFYYNPQHMYGQSYIYISIFAMMGFTHLPQIHKSKRQRKNKNMGIPTYER